MDDFLLTVPKVRRKLHWNFTYPDGSHFLCPECGHDVFTRFDETCFECASCHAKAVPMDRHLGARGTTEAHE